MFAFRAGRTYYYHAETNVTQWEKPHALTHAVVHVGEHAGGGGGGRRRGLRVLVLGGGEGATVRDVLKCASVDLCVMCEIDPEVVEVAKRFLPAMASALLESAGNPRFKLVIGDCVAFLQGAPMVGAEDIARGGWDLIVSDLSDPYTADSEDGKRPSGALPVAVPRNT